MTTLATQDFLTDFNPTHYAFLQLCRQAWQEAIDAYGNMGNGDPNHLLRAVQQLRELLDYPDADIMAAQAYEALKSYPMPTAPDQEAETGMWDLFFRLVLMVQSQSPDRILYARALEHFTEGAELKKEWWLARAEAYAPLGLTLGTRV